MQRTMKFFFPMMLVIGGVATVTGIDATTRPATVAYKVSGPATRITNPSQYVRTASFNNSNVPVTASAYYIVKGVQQNKQWQYPFSVVVTGATMATIPLAINQAHHTELVEVGIPTPRLLRLANPTGGMSHKSTVALRNK